MNKNVCKHTKICRKSTKLPERHTAKRRKAAANLSAYKAEWVRKTMRKEDGRGPTQATRKAVVSTASGGTKQFLMVIDMFFASWIVVDELHAAGSEHTLTYSQIITPILAATKSSQQPGITGVTGSALANGIVTTLTFA